jgi:regulation of enolase protein 1 (concanavalin A-like superfamily)
MVLSSRKLVSTHDEDDVDDEDNNGKAGWWKVVTVTKQQQKEKKVVVLQLAPPAKRDFWRKTYYEPLLVKDDAPFLYRLIENPTTTKDKLPVMVETSFTIHNPKSQFDQAGIMIRIDHEHWVKTGIEVVDGIARLSCVVTNCFSDWSTQIWPGDGSDEPSIRIRVHILPQHGGSIVVEAAPPLPKSSVSNDTNDDDDENQISWNFVRIAHLNRNMKHDMLNDEQVVKDAFQGPSIPQDSTMMMVGIFGACPVDQAGMVVTFDHLSIRQGTTFVHDAD